MNSLTDDFTIRVTGVKGNCPAGDDYAARNTEEKKIPVLSCEGPCIRGEIARLVANRVANELPSHARACAPETFFVPHSGMSKWVRQSEKIVMIDGCFLKCHGRVLENLVKPEQIVHIDVLPLYNKYTDIFSVDEVPAQEREALARQVADRIIAGLREDNERSSCTGAKAAASTGTSCCG